MPVYCILYASLIFFSFTSFYVFVSVCVCLCVYVCFIFYGPCCLIIKVIDWLIDIFLSFYLIPGQRVVHRPNPFQEVPEASWISYEQTPMMNSQESDPGGCGALLDRWGRTRAAGDRCQWSPVARLTSDPNVSTTRRWPHRKLSLYLTCIEGDEWCLSVHSSAV